MLIKICGLSTPETLAAAIDAGATHVGLVHFEPSPRHVSLNDAARLRTLVSQGVKAVLLIINADTEATKRAIDTVEPDVVQFHGSETPEWIASLRAETGIEAWKALGVRSADTLTDAARYEGAVDRLLFDAPAPQADTALPGGNGIGFDWSLLKDHSHHLPWGLAGGLNAGNVGEAITATGTPLVDASSGLETAPGVKDVDLIRAFCKAAREA